MDTSSGVSEPVDLENGFLWMADVAEEVLRWLWPGYVPCGKVTILDGDPGLGKSTLTLDLAARISRGDTFPDDAGEFSGGASLIVSGEDDIADTMKPRLRAAGADMSLIASHRLRVGEDGRVIPFTVPDDLPELERAINPVTM